MGCFTFSRGARYLSLLMLAWLLLSPARVPAAGQTTHQQASTEIKVGILNAPQMGFYDPGQQLMGFEAELAQMLCERLPPPYQCTFRLQSFRQNLQDVQQGRLDMALSNILVTDERLQRIRFSQRYMRSTPSYIGDPNRQPTDRPARVAVLEGSVHARFLHLMLQADRLPVVYPDVQDLYEALLSGVVDQVMAPSIMQLGFLHQPQSEHLDMLEPPLDLPHIAGDIAVAMPATHAGLQQQINNALQQLLTDGSYDRLNKRYFPFNTY